VTNLTRSNRSHWISSIDFFGLGALIVESIESLIESIGIRSRNRDRIDSIASGTLRER
jgi:hypothetical protein